MYENRILCVPDNVFTIKNDKRYNKKVGPFLFHCIWNKYLTNIFTYTNKLLIMVANDIFLLM